MSRVNPWAVRRIVDRLPITSTEADVRAAIRARCTDADFARRAEESAVRYWQRVAPAGRVR